MPIFIRYVCAVHRLFSSRRYHDVTPPIIPTFFRFAIAGFYATDLHVFIVLTASHNGSLSFFALFLRTEGYANRETELLPMATELEPSGVAGESHPSSATFMQYIPQPDGVHASFKFLVGASLSSLLLPSTFLHGILALSV